jgi:hypothetical protein
VKVLKLGARRPRRILVRFVDDGFEGLQDWVPPTRLKALWREGDDYRAWEARWDAVIADSPARESPEVAAAGIVLEQVLANALFKSGFNATEGVTFIEDIAAAAEALDVDAAWFRSDLRSFEEAGSLIVPWSTTVQIARLAAQRDPHAVLRWVEQDEARARRDAIYRRRSARVSGYDPWAITGEEAALVDEEYGVPIRAVLREWTGAEPVELRDELRTLRAESERLGRLASSALEALRASGHKREADRLQRQSREVGDSESPSRRRPPAARRRVASEGIDGPERPGRQPQKPQGRAGDARKRA